MMYSAQDFLCDDDGDLVLMDGDLQLADPVRSLVQWITFRLRTSFADWQRINPNVVADLQEFVGQKNSAELGKLIEQAVVNSLTFLSPLPMSELDIDVVPVNIDEVAINIKILNVNTPDGFVGEVRVSFKLDLLEGEMTSLTSGRY